MTGYCGGESGGVFFVVGEERLAFGDELASGCDRDVVSFCRLRTNRRMSRGLLCATTGLMHCNKIASHFAIGQP
jgi:hypothetical protein